MSLRSESEGAPGAAWTLPEELQMLADLGDAETVREVIAVFQRDTETRIQNMRAALAAADAPQVRAQAHAIKGSSGQVGAMRVSGLCRQIEAAALAQDLAAAAGLLPELEAEFQTVRAAMSRTKIA
jgi:HPt (histidine-containing phosphotransfer) domain-containing protein